MQLCNVYIVAWDGPVGDGVVRAGAGRGRLGWPWPGSGWLWGTHRRGSGGRTRVHPRRSRGLDRQDGAEGEGAYPCETSLPGLAGNVAVAPTLRVHPLVELILE